MILWCLGYAWKGNMRTAFKVIFLKLVNEQLTKEPLSSEDIGGLYGTFPNSSLFRREEGLFKPLTNLQKL